MEFFYPNEKAKATFYFEDKKTIIYEKLYEKGSPFSYEFVEPKFGPYKGWKYTFLGWDMNDDGVADELPSFINEHTSFVAIYDKKATADETFSSDILFDVSSEYGDAIEESNLYDGSDIELNSSQRSQVKNLIFMHGSEHTGEYKSSNYPYLEFISFSSTIDTINGPFPKVTINNGYIHGSIGSGAFSNGINNTMLNYDATYDSGKTNHRLHISTNAFSGCSDLKYINVFATNSNSCSPILDNGAFNGCSNLLLYNAYPNFAFPDGNSNDQNLSAFYQTNMSFFDMRGFGFYKNGGKIKSNAEGTITILIGNADDTFVECLEDSRQYNVLVGYTYHAYAGVSNYPLVRGSALNATNVHYYYYSDTAKLDGSRYFRVGETLDGWHFNSNGFPSTVY